MRLRPLELARPLVLVAIGVSVTTAVSRDSASAQPWPERRGQGVCYTQHGWCPPERAERIPVGIACYCILPDGGPSGRVTSPLYDEGRVSPYFTLHPPPVPTVIK